MYAGHGGWPSVPERVMDWPRRGLVKYAHTERIGKWTTASLHFCGGLQRRRSPIDDSRQDACGRRGAARRGAQFLHAFQPRSRQPPPRRRREPPPAIPRTSPSRRRPVKTRSTCGDDPPKGHERAPVVRLRPRRPGGVCRRAAARVGLLENGGGPGLRGREADAVQPRRPGGRRRCRNG